MIIKTVELNHCKEGDILAADIINSYGVTLAAKDTFLNEYLKEKLAVNGIDSVLIYDESADYDEDLCNTYTEAVTQTKRILQELVSGKNLDCRQVSCIADRIFNSTDEYDKVIRCLENVQNADEYTYNHCVNVAFYCMLITKWLGLSERKIKTAIKAGLLHDIGKVRISNEILNKKGKLTEKEFDVIKQHPVLGYEILKDIKEIDQEIKKAVLLHHERIDGSGYPYHYNYDKLNLLSRITAVADVFDAMTSDRVYKGRSTPFEVFEMFRTVGMGIFDTRILNVFLKKLAGYLTGSRVLLNTGRTGEIVFVPLQNITYPIVKVESKYYDLSQEDGIKIVSML